MSLEANSEDQGSKGSVARKTGVGWAVVSFVQINPGVNPIACERPVAHAPHEKSDGGWCCGHEDPDLRHTNSFRHDVANKESPKARQTVVFVPDTSDFVGFTADTIVADTLAAMLPHAPTEEQVAMKAMLAEGATNRQLARDGVIGAPRRTVASSLTRTFAVVKTGLALPPRANLKVPYIPDLIPKTANQHRV